MNNSISVKRQISNFFYVLITPVWVKKVKFCLENHAREMSSHLVWGIIRNNNAFLLKKRNISKPFSTEANNLTNVNSYRYNGLIHKKSVGIVDAADKKGFTVVYKKARKENKPKQNIVKRTMKAGPRRSLYKLKRLLNANKYRTDLTKAALRRASAVLRSQKPLPAKKQKTKKPE